MPFPYISENYSVPSDSPTPLSANTKASFRRTIPRLPLVGLNDNQASSPVSYITDHTSRVTQGDEDSTALLLESFPKWLPTNFVKYGPVNATLFASLLSCLISAICWLFFPVFIGRLLSWQFTIIILFTIVSVILCATSLIHLYYTQTTTLSTIAVVVVAVLLSVLSEIVLDGASSAQSYTLLLVILHTLLGRDSRLIMVVPCVVISWEILVVVKLMIGLRFVPNDTASHALCIITRPLALLLGFLTIRIFTINLASQHTYLAKLMEDIHRQGLIVQAGQEMRQQLIHNIFPEDIAAQLVDAMQKYDKKASSAMSATGRSSSNGTNPEGKGALFLPMPSNITRGFTASIGFADIVNFTSLASSISPIELVETLNSVVQAIDRACARYPGVHKIKTIGDAYMAAAHPPLNKMGQSFDREIPVDGSRKQLNDNDCALSMMHFSDRMHHIVKHYSIAGNPLSIRVGVSYGPVVSGIIGLSKLCYDMWGDTVNTASRMESLGLPGATQVTPQLYELVKDQLHFVYRGVVEVKGKGPVQTWLHYPTEPQSNSGHHLNATIPPAPPEDTGTVHSWFSSFCVPFDSSSEGGSSHVERRASVPSTESGTSTPMLTIRSSGERVSASPREVQQRARFFSVESSHTEDHVPMIIEEEETHVVAPPPPPHPTPHTENRFVSPRPASKAARRVLTIREHDNNAVMPIISSSSSAASSDTYTRSPSLLSVSSLPEVINPIVVHTSQPSSSSRPPTPPTPSVIVATEPTRTQSNLSVIALQSPRAPQSPRTQTPRKLAYY